MTIDDFMTYSIKLLQVLGLNEGTAETIISGTIAILFLSWLNLTGYIILNEPKVLEHWKYPNLIVLSITAIFGILSFLVAYLLYVAVMLSEFSEPAITHPGFFLIAILMELCMLGILLYGRSKKAVDSFADPSPVPQGFLVLFPKMLDIAIFLFCSIITLFLLHNALNTGLLNLGELTISQKVSLWIASVIFACLTGLFGLYVRFGREKVNEGIKRLKSKILK